ncbi:MAG: hypothetical protein ABJE47_23845 [bacterium]
MRRSYLWTSTPPDDHRATEHDGMLHYSLLFIHVAAAMAIFASLGMEAVALAQLRQATDEPATRASLTTFGWSQRTGGPGGLVLVLSGITLATMYWHWRGAWMGLGFLGMVTAMAVGGIMTRRALKRLPQANNGGRSGALPLDVVPALRQSFAIRVALLTGVVFLMTAKPEPPVALGALLLAAIIGLIVGRGSARAQSAPAAVRSR